ncbi:MAG: esterase/lipase family protein, partial [Burkholderiales bacterium]
MLPLSTQSATGTLAQFPFVGPESKDAHKRRLKVLYVLGFGSDCAGQPRLIEQEMQPFLAARGYRMQVATVSGLGSSASNALALRDTILAAGTAQEPVVIIGHSKGAVDALQVLVDYPQGRSRVAALVSLAGAIGGSPLADRAPTSV